MVGRARFLHRAGYTVLLVDLPGHGESMGDRITFGVRESDGVRAALDYLRRAAPGERVGALGVSLGGASLLLGTGEPAANAADAVVLEAVYPTIGEAVADRLRIRLGAVGPPLAPLLTWQLRPQLGVGAEDLRPIDRVRALRVPVLVVAGEADRRMAHGRSRGLCGNRHPVPHRIRDPMRRAVDNPPVLASRLDWRETGAFRDRAERNW
jgi:alpha-beta hydrolase superfamily lysophospholipase